MTRAVCTLGLAIAVLVAPLSAARADEPAASAAAHDDAARAHARSRYLEGVAFVQKAQWSDALAAFEESARVFPNPTTTLDIGACERALGRYVRARATLQRALDESAASASPLPESSAADAKAFLGEIDRLLVTAAVHVEPVDAAIAIDGRPLAPSTRDGKPVLAAGVLPPGPGAPPPSADFVVVLDPGVHVITLSRKGFAEAVVNRSFAPGVRSTLDLKLDRLPATLKITASREGALVRVNDVDVGPTPVDVLRPAGSYKVRVQDVGFVPYAAQVTVQPGEEVKLRANLVEEKPSLLSRWWFWTGAVVVVAGGAVVTYAATRPAPKPPAFETGNTNWLVHASALRF